MPKSTIPLLTALALSGFLPAGASAQFTPRTSDAKAIDVAGFYDSTHHWYDIEDEEKIITARPARPRYAPAQVRQIANNVLLFQKSNGGWLKNYDMLAILTEEQREAVLAARDEENTTFDNGATHSHVEYLAKAYSMTGDEAYRGACLRGLDFILAAQYANGGWPQFFPDTSGYRKYITFNDDAMIGVMTVLRDILQRSPEYLFVDAERCAKVEAAYKRGIECILKCQVTQNGTRLAWGQQHDNIDFRPREARNFEPASLAARESAGIVLFLMSIDHPDRNIDHAVQGAVAWIEKSKIFGLKVKEIVAPLADYKYRKKVNFDRIVVKDPKAPPIWARMYEPGTNLPLFCNRDKKPVYSLAEVDRERRTGYAWYTYDPAKVLKKYPAWRKRWVQQGRQR